MNPASADRPLRIETSPRHPGVRTIALEQPGRPVVVLDADLLRRLELALNELPLDTRGLVISSVGTPVFAAGADLRAIIELNDDALDRYLMHAQRVLGRIASLPYPTAAAVHGAALGGGLELAMHCDLMVGARGRGDGKTYPVGLPECGLGICPAWGGTGLFPARLDPAKALELMASGTTLPSNEAAEMGLFDGVVEQPGEVHEAAEDAIAGWIGSRRVSTDTEPRCWVGRPEHAARVLAALDALAVEVTDRAEGAAIAATTDIGLAQGWEAALESERVHFLKLRARPEARSAIGAFLDRGGKAGERPG